MISKARLWIFVSTFHTALLCLGRDSGVPRLVFHAAVQHLIQIAPRFPIHLADARSQRVYACGPMRQPHIELFHWQGIWVRSDLCAPTCPVV
jgi:hypothetical protein